MIADVVTAGRLQIFSAVELYIQSLIGTRKRKRNGKVTWEKYLLTKPLAAVEPLKRLATSHRPDALERALIELPPAAHDALNDACLELNGQPLGEVMKRWPTIPGTLRQLDPIELKLLIPAAIKHARRYGNRNPIRDLALTQILERHSVLIGHWPSAKEAARFLASLESAYKELLPAEGFGVKSGGAIYRLLKKARPDA